MACHADRALVTGIELPEPLAVPEPACAYTVNRDLSPCRDERQPSRGSIQRARRKATGMWSTGQTWHADTLALGHICRHSSQPHTIGQAPCRHPAASPMERQDANRIIAISSP